MSNLYSSQEAKTVLFKGQKDNIKFNYCRKPNHSKEIRASDSTQPFYPYTSTIGLRKLFY